MKYTEFTIAVVAISITIILFVVCAGTRGEVTGRISGTIVNEKSAVMPGASVRIDGTSLGAASSFDGVYYVLNVPEGIYNVIAQSIGYNRVIVEDVNVIADSTIIVDFQLTPDTLGTWEYIILETH